jgi:glycosyltransferase involved in cell wall biosynthesis
MAAGVPVVVSDQVAVHSEVERAGAGLVCTCSSKSLASALCRILEDPAAAKRMGANGAAVARERYSISAVTARLLKVYDSILHGHPQTDVVAL